MKQFVIKSTVLTSLIYILGAILYSTVLKPHYLAILPFFVLFFFLVTNFVHFTMLKIVRKSGSRFTSYYMAISFIKMFFFITVAIVCVILDKEHAKPIILNFLLLYAVYTFFEISEFLKGVKHKK